MEEVEYRRVRIDSGSGEVVDAEEWQELNLPTNRRLTLVLDTSDCTYDAIEMREKPRRTDDEILSELWRICDQEYTSLHKQGLRKILRGEF